MSMIHANVPLVYENIYIWFVKPICFATPNGVVTHSLRSPDLDNGVHDLLKQDEKLGRFTSSLYICHTKSNDCTI